MGSTNDFYKRSKAVRSAPYVAPVRPRKGLSLELHFTPMYEVHSRSFETALVEALVTVLDNVVLIYPYHSCHKRTCLILLFYVAKDG